MQQRLLNSSHAHILHSEQQLYGFGDSHTVADKCKRMNKIIWSTNHDDNGYSCIVGLSLWNKLNGEIDYDIFVAFIGHLMWYICICDIYTCIMWYIGNISGDTYTQVMTETDYDKCLKMLRFEDCNKILDDIGSANCLWSERNKPLSETLLTYHQRDPLAFMPGYCLLEYWRYHHVVFKLYTFETMILFFKSQWAYNRINGLFSARNSTHLRHNVSKYHHLHW